MTDSVRVLSIQQPYADFTFRMRRWAENRSWQTRYRGPLYIHASRLDTAEVSAWKERGIDLRAHVPLQTGAIIGRVQLLDCLPSEQIHRFAPKAYRKEWLFGKVDGRKAIPPELATVAPFLKTVDPDSWQHVAWDEYAWIFTEPQLLKEPITVKGRLNIWEFPFDTRLEAFA